MITESDIYWLTRMDEIKGLLNGLGMFGFLCSIVIGVIGLLLAHDSNEDEWHSETYKASARINAQRYPAFLKSSACLLFLATLLVGAKAFTPSTNEMAAIKVIPKIANNEDLQGLGKDMVELAKEWLRELKPKKTAENQ